MYFDTVILRNIKHFLNHCAFQIVKSYLSLFAVPNIASVTLFILSPIRISLLHCDFRLLHLSLGLRITEDTSTTSRFTVFSHHPVLPKNSSHVAT